MKMDIKERLLQGRLDATLASLYHTHTNTQKDRYITAYDMFCRVYGEREDIRFFSAPGRSEIGGNHTDHQNGCVLAAAVTLDMIAAAAQRPDNRVTIHSAGYAPVELTLDDLANNKAEQNSSVSLVRGIAAGIQAKGLRIGGFDAVITSDVPKGSGLSSSAAYSILICTIFSCLFNEGTIHPTQQALISKFAENVYFGKPSGLMDQLASATGGFVAIDFNNPEEPVIQRIDCDPEELGYAVCIVDAKGSHANLTPEYAAVPEEMGRVSAYFGKTALRQVDEQAFYAALPAIRASAGDRAVLRAMHFFGENRRAIMQAQALRERDMSVFLQLINESGRSSFMQLQNVCPADPEERSLALALALSERFLGNNGAWRIHGGGFAGTIQAFVPIERVDAYVSELESVFGKGCCYRLAVRPVGGVEIK